MFAGNALTLKHTKGERSGQRANSGMQVNLITWRMGLTLSVADSTSNAITASNNVGGGGGPKRCSIRTNRWGWRVLYGQLPKLPVPTLRVSCFHRDDTAWVQTTASGTNEYNAIIVKQNAYGSSNRQ